MKLTFCLAIGSLAAQGAGSSDCAPCHRRIYNNYTLTPMAASSGKVGSGPIRESFERSRFTHGKSAIEYRVRSGKSGYSFEFGSTRDGKLRGEKRLSYFVGSGAVARSYLIDAGSFLFEAPVAYYTQSLKWDLAPGYDQYTSLYLTRPILPGCLSCHASFLDIVPRTQNSYADPPFREGGVACERCHGPGEAHIARMRSGAMDAGPGIVNPSKLSPDRRDSVCSQCHLSGDVRVMRPGRDWSSFRPGERLSDSMTFFVRAGGSPGMKVTSHVENLAESACKVAAGDRMWCGSCHDAHSMPKAGERAAWFRQKCLSCHQIDQCKETTARRKGDDCTGCHMPRNTVVDAQHVVYTDHSIPRRPRSPAATPRENGDLVPFGEGGATARDLALAYAITAQREDGAGYRERVLPLLEKTARENPEDAEVLTYLAELYRNTSRPELAIPLYERAMRLDDAQVTAFVGLGAIRMERGEHAEAIRLWTDALGKNSGLQLVRLNLAIAQWRTGDTPSALSSLEKAVELNPAFTPASGLLLRLRQTPRRPQ